LTSATTIWETLADSLYTLSTIIYLHLHIYGNTYHLQMDQAMAHYKKKLLLCFTILLLMLNTYNILSVCVGVGWERDKKKKKKGERS